LGGECYRTPRPLSMSPEGPKPALTPRMTLNSEPRMTGL